MAVQLSLLHIIYSRITKAKTDSVDVIRRSSITLSSSQLDLQYGKLEVPMTWPPLTVAGFPLVYTSR